MENNRCQAPKEVVEEIKRKDGDVNNLLRCGENDFCSRCKKLTGINPHRLALENMLNRVQAKVQENQLL